MKATSFRLSVFLTFAALPGMGLAADPLQRADGLPAPKGDFSLYIRAYWPQPAITDGLWTPPSVVKLP